MFLNFLIGKFQFEKIYVKFIFIRLFVNIFLFKKRLDTIQKRSKIYVFLKKFFLVWKENSEFIFYLKVSYFPFLLFLFNFFFIFYRKICRFFFLLKKFNFFLFEKKCFVPEMQQCKILYYDNRFIFYENRKNCKTGRYCRFCNRANTFPNNSIRKKYFGNFKKLSNISKKKIIFFI